MSKIQITGGNRLSGTITPGGNKNSVLPILCATLLTDEDVIIHNVPDTTDVGKLLDALREIGTQIDHDKENTTVKINTSNASIDKLRNGLPIGMRASSLLLAPLISRFKDIEIAMNIGGCSLGIREIDNHIQAFKELGVEVSETDHGMIQLYTPGLKGKNIWPDFMSVTGTENIIMAAVLAEGTTILNNAASEPHVQDLCHMLVDMGAKIEGIGSSLLKITGVNKLSGTEVTVSSDHHEITTFLALGAMTGGEIRVENVNIDQFPLIVRAFAKLGVNVEFEGTTAFVRENQTFIPEENYTKNLITKIEAAPWPYFPVDLLPLMIALSLKTKGNVKFWNKVYEGGLLWMPELVKMGAKIEMCDPHRVIVMGPTELKAAKINCPDIIRVAIALIMAALVAEGTSTLTNIDSIYRAHPNFVENLRKLGAEIQEINE